MSHAPWCYLLFSERTSNSRDKSENEMPDKEANIYITIPHSDTINGLHHVDMNITSFTDVACISEAQVALT